MAFRLTHIQDYNRFISIDLGFYRVHAGVYDVSGGELDCIGFSSVRQSQRNFDDGSIVDIRGVSQAIEQAIIQASQKLDTPPSDVIINFPSSAFVLDMLSTQYVRADKDSTLTMQELDSMIKLIEKDSFDRARAKSKRQFGEINDDLKLVSSTIVSVMIDGKKIANPIGFSWSRIRLSVLNIFVPSSEFNIIRSVVSSLEKRVISIIPSPLILPKYIEHTDLLWKTVCIIDVGYAHTSITVTQDNEIIGFESFAYGARALMQHLYNAHSFQSALQIENVLQNSNDIKKDPNSEIVTDFLTYLKDMTFWYLISEHIHVRLDALVLHGWIFHNSAIFSQFSSIFSQAIGYDVHTITSNKMLTSHTSEDRAIVQWLAQMANELLLVKKDPLVRILRYVLYQYQ